MDHSNVKALLAVASLICLTGCTHLEVSPHAAGGAATGYAYALDFTQYEIAVNRTLVGCDPGGAPRIKVEATIKPQLVPDAEQVYVVDPKAMISAFKTSDIALDFKDGRLIGVNASAEDHTAEVIASAATTIAKVAAFSAGIPSLTSGGVKAVSACKPKAVASLQALKDASPKLTKNTQTLQDEQAKLADLTTAYVVKPADDLRRKIQDKRDAIKVAQKDLETLTKTVSESQAWLKTSVTVVWPETSLDVDSRPSAYQLDKDARERWFDGEPARAAIKKNFRSPQVLRGGDGVVRLDNDTPVLGNAAVLGITYDSFKLKYPALTDAKFDYEHCEAITGACDLLAALREALVVDQRKDLDQFDAALLGEVSLHLRVRGTYGQAPQTAKGGSPRDGIRYRVPASGQLLVCSGASACTIGEEALIGTQVGPVAQLGAVFNIPFESPAFASGSMEVKFDDQGRLLRAGLKRTNTAALDVAKSAGSVADQYGTYMKAHEGREQADYQRAEAVLKARKAVGDAQAALEETPTDLANKEVTYLEAQKKLAALRAELNTGSANADLTRDVARTKLEVELADLKTKLSQDPNADQQVVRDAYDAQAAVLTARKTALDAEAEVIRAERELAKTRAGA
jgi:hypothetical protein